MITEDVIFGDFFFFFRELFFFLRFGTVLVLQIVLLKENICRNGNGKSIGGQTLPLKPT